MSSNNDNSRSIADDTDVAVIRGATAYAATAPFPPSVGYPELPDIEPGLEDNPAYSGVRSLFHSLGMDEANFGTSQWNPLGDMISRGNTVVIKPNLVAHRNLGSKSYGLTDTDSLVTHGSVLRVVIDYVALALNGEGQILVCDCPVQGTNWQQAVQLVGLDRIEEYVAQQWPGVNLQLRDFRLGKAVLWRNTVVKRIIDESDLAQYTEVDLKQKSFLMPLMASDYAFGVSDYPRHRMRAAHTLETNRYLFPTAVLHADAIINLPKMKTHMKAGITCSLKNFVGTIGHKDYLPHFRYGGHAQGGDEYPELGFVWNLMWSLMHLAWDRDEGKLKLVYILMARVLASLLRYQPNVPKPVWSLGSGSWHGNDTLWRTVLDIHRAFLYYNPDRGAICDDLYSGRAYLAILDGIVAGEKEGPLSPTPRAEGLLLASRNPAALDTAAAALMGLDYRRIPQLAHSWIPGALPLVHYGPDEIAVHGNVGAKDIRDLLKIGVAKPFVPSKGFAGHIEAEHGFVSARTSR